MVVDVQNTTIVSADGSTKNLGEYSGDVLLIVNVASFCGNTAQYEDLQKLHDLYSQKVLGFLRSLVMILEVKNRIPFLKLKNFVQLNLE